MGTRSKVADVVIETFLYTLPQVLSPRFWPAISGSMAGWGIAVFGIYLSDVVISKLLQIGDPQSNFFYYFLSVLLTSLIILVPTSLILIFNTVFAGTNSQVALARFQPDAFLVTLKLIGNLLKGYFYRDPFRNFQFIESTFLHTWLFFSNKQIEILTSRRLFPFNQQEGMTYTLLPLPPPAFIAA